jgi:glycosyltransferase involved in cell wall biosynthesis
MEVFRNNNPRLLIIGPIFKTKDGWSGQGGQLFTALNLENYIVLKVSSYRNRLIRGIDIIGKVIFSINKYDIILLQSFGLFAFIIEDWICLLSKWLKKPILFTLRGGAFYEFYQDHSKWASRVLKRANLVNTPSNYLQEKIKVENVKIEYLPNFINLRNFPYSDKPRNYHSLLWVRAFHEIYNPELAIEAVNIVKQQYPEVKLTMIGPDQGSKADCIRLIEKLGLAGNIELLGYVPNNELYKYYQSFHVFLTTTRYESFGVALVEAGACGIPCVSVAVGEIPYVWTDRENILFAERNPVDFAEKITELFDNSELANYISINACKNAQKYTWENVRHLWLDTIERLSRVGDVRN